MSTGFSFPWEKAAMRGEELPDGLSLPDQMAYWSTSRILFLRRPRRRRPESAG